MSSSKKPKEIKQDELKVINTETQCSEIVKIQRENFDNSKRKVTCHVQNQLQKTVLGFFQQKPCRREGSGIIYQKCRKMLTKNTKFTPVFIATLFTIVMT